MKKLTAWLTLGSFAFLGSLTVVSCGSDEATGEGSGGGGIIGGSGGMDGGVVRDSGTTIEGELGQACATDAECGEGLICIQHDDPALGGGAPPGGLCTLPCTTDDECLEFSSDAYCIPFDRLENDLYCIEACTPGDSLGQKCHGREEFTCDYIGYYEGGPQCVDTGDCSSGELCIESECVTIVTGCTPQCGGDYDCANGFFCDFEAGTCVSDEPTGKSINEACDPEADVEECNGFCFPSYDDETIGSCSAYCNFGSIIGCGYSGEGQADAGCIYASAISLDPGAGDLGICGQLCNCNSDCTVPGELCASLEYPDLEQFWQRAGYCRPIVPSNPDFTEETSLDCGAGGTPSSGGAGGDGGTPSTGGVGGFGGQGGG